MPWAAGNCRFPPSRGLEALWWTNAALAFTEIGVIFCKLPKLVIPLSTLRKIRLTLRSIVSRTMPGTDQ